MSKKDESVNKESTEVEEETSEDTEENKPIVKEIKDNKKVTEIQKEKTSDEFKDIRRDSNKLDVKVIDSFPSTPVREAPSAPERTEAPREQPQQRQRETHEYENLSYTTTYRPTETRQPSFSVQPMQNLSPRISFENQVDLSPTSLNNQIELRREFQQSIRENYTIEYEGNNLERKERLRRDLF